MHSKQFFRLSKSISFLWLSMHNSWIDSAERFSHTTFLHTKFARNWRHEPPGRTLPIAFSIGWQCTVNYHTSHNLNHMHEWTTTHSQRGRGVCFVYLSSSLFSLRFLSFFFCQYIHKTLVLSSLQIYANTWHDRVTLKGTRWCTHASPVMSPVVRCTRWVHRARYRWYIAENAVTSLTFSARRDLDLLCSIRRGWAEPKESVRCQRRKLQRKCCATGYYHIISHRYLDLVIEMTRRIIKQHPSPFLISSSIVRDYIYSTSFLLDKLQFALIIRYYQGYYIITG